MQVLSPFHQAIGANLGSRTAAWLYDELTTACVRPPGMGHLEDSRLTADLTMARDFDHRHQRPSTLYFDGLHRVRHGDDGRGTGRGYGAGGVHLVGPAATDRGVAGHAIGFFVKAQFGTIAIPTKFAKRSATRTMRTASP